MSNPLVITHRATWIRDWYIFNALSNLPVGTSAWAGELVLSTLSAPTVPVFSLSTATAATMSWTANGILRTIITDEASFNFAEPRYYFYLRVIDPASALDTTGGGEAKVVAQGVLSFVKTPLIPETASPISSSFTSGAGVSVFLSIPGFTAPPVILPPAAPSPAPVPAPSPAVVIPGNTTTAGNGIGVVEPGTTLVPLTAAAPVSAFSACAMIVGGIRTGDIATDKDSIIVFPVEAAAGGASARCVLLGPVTNTNVGPSSWNFTVGLPVFLSSAGTLTQTAQASFRYVGHALSSNTLNVVQEHVSRLVYPHVESYISIPLVTIDAANSTLVSITGSSAVSVVASNLTTAQDLRSLTVKTIQDATGGRVFTFGTGFSATPVIPANQTLPNKVDVYRFVFESSSQKFYLVSHTAI